jgi:antitoxin component HigA of HigAB toxin-antitoxin module
MFQKIQPQCDSSKLESDPVATMLFLMEERNLPLTELVPILGCESVVDDVITGKISINGSAADSIGKFLRVGSTLFS